MPKAVDAVRPLKNERPGEGTEDDTGFPTQADSTEDAIASAGVYLGEPGQDAFDKVVGTYREDNEIWLFDGCIPGGARLCGMAAGLILVTDQGEVVIEDTTEKALEIY